MVFRVLYHGGIHRRGKFILASAIRSAISAVAPGDNATTELRNLPNRRGICDTTLGVEYGPVGKIVGTSDRSWGGGLATRLYTCLNLTALH